MSHTYSLDYVAQQASAKRTVLRTATARYFLSAAFAGALIALVLAVSMRLGQLFHSNGSPYYAIAYSAFFGTALVAIIVSKTELFTSNVMYMTLGKLTGRVSSGEMLASWSTVYFGNLAGILLFTVVWMQTGGLGDYPADHVASQIAAVKTGAPFMKIFWKGVLCNWIICLAVWLPMKLENEMAKIALVFLLVFAFFFSGFEHSIANMALFSLVVAHAPEALSFADIMHNMLPATLGNIVGGGIGVALLAFMLERHTLSTPAATAQKQADKLNPAIS
ncbi:formate/nitrite transporter family protein [Craterilacuibacter sinensis]|uniref:Transporter n=1 Tax=Craterilacuibacter sinensis TaxID=2686017 RepID=A0A845BVX8_9NEIS|nr:formate/nitrite transporter family protein [Craterilacuibacter sinensis]MXR38266.1 transporter [Craterilacuibacter sinensis]RQW28055.1 transporter [Rhodobacteraceae bacterium CH30]